MTGAARQNETRQNETRQNEARLKVVLTEVVNTVESLMDSGLSSASPSITDQFQLAFEQAAKCRQLRLGSNLRLVNEELKRFFKDDTHFSERRLALFLNRCWQMSRQVIAGSEASSPVDAERHNEVCDEISVVIQGVLKKTVPGVFCALEFRLRRSDGKAYSKPLLWSCLLATADNLNVKPESLLALDQPQKFKPSVFLQSTVVMKNVRLVEDDSAFRLQLGAESEVVAGDTDISAPDDTGQWGLDRVASAMESFQPTPLDLEIQPQFEVYLDNWSVDEELTHTALDGKVLFQLSSNGKRMYLCVDSGDDGVAQLQFCRERLKRKRPSRGLLFGLMHYEQGLILIQPLTLWKRGQSPGHLMITDDKTDYAALLKILK